LKGGSYDGLMHGADWLPTFSQIAGFDLNGTKPLDGIGHWKEINSGGGGGNDEERLVFLGNATDLCSWPDVNDPRRGRYLREGSPQAVKYEGNYYDSDDQPLCGFAIRKGAFKLIKDYGGAPTLACNISDAGEKVDCRDGDPSPVCYNGYCLFDVINDQEEMNESSQNNTDVLEDMKSELEGVLESYHQYELDPDCPDFKFGSDEHVGNTYEPWC